jgi:hypothetical protein
MCTIIEFVVSINILQQCNDIPYLTCQSCSVLEKQPLPKHNGRNQPKTKGCFIDQGNKFYPSASVWHPYVEPFGYMKCVVCTCLVSNVV